MAVRPSEMEKELKNVKKILAGILAAAMVMAFSVPCMADNATPQVFVNFICDGVTSGKYVPAGSNVTAPSVPLHAGFTFCGFDKSLYNVRTNTTFVAVYVNNSLGEEAIKQKKASLPTPAITATTVADPNAAAPALPTVPTATTPAATGAALLDILKAQQAAVTTASANNAAGKALAAAQSVAQAATPTVQAAAQTVAQAAQSATQAPAAQAAAQTVNQATQAAAQTVNQATQAAAQNPTIQAAAAQASQAVTAAASVLPSWAVPLHGVDQAGAAEVYKYWKTVKNTDDATIQANWDALLNHYAGHGTQGW